MAQFFKKSQVFEQLVNGISETLTNDTQLRDSGIKFFGGKNLFTGISGYTHQIDVSLQNENSLLLIECKYWARKITVKEYLTFLARINDIQNNTKWQTHNKVA